MRLFDRVVELRVGDTDINGLDISFEIEKDESPSPNPRPNNRLFIMVWCPVLCLVHAVLSG